MADSGDNANARVARDIRCKQTTSITFEEIRRYKEALLGKDISFYRWFHLVGILGALLGLAMSIVSISRHWFADINGR